MSVHYFPGSRLTTLDDPSVTRADEVRSSHALSVKFYGHSADVSNALTVTQRSPGWNNRKPDIQRVQLGTCTLLAVPYRRWAWRRHEQRVAAQRRMEA